MTSIGRLFIHGITNRQDPEAWARRGTSLSVVLLSLVAPSFRLLNRTLAQISAWRVGNRLE